MVMLSGCVFPVRIGNDKHITCRGDVELRNLGQEQNLTGFTSIVINGSADLKYTQDDAFSVKVEANNEVFDHLNFRVEEGVLILETKEKVQIRAEKYDIYVSAPLLNSFVANGSTDAEISSIRQAEDLTITVNGAGDCELDNIKLPCLTFNVNGAADVEIAGLDVEKFYMLISGAGDAKISGKADYASFTVSGAADIDARDLNCDNIEKHKSGVANIRTR